MLQGNLDDDQDTFCLPHDPSDVVVLFGGHVRNAFHLKFPYVDSCNFFTLVNHSSPICILFFFPSSSLNIYKG